MFKNTQYYLVSRSALKAKHMKTIKVDTNKAGCRFALVCNQDTYVVYRECCNYSNSAPGGIAKSWRYCEKGLSLEAAQKLFDRKIAGKQKP